MELKEHENGFKITKWYVSPTLKQDFPDYTSFPIPGREIYCVPKIKLSKDPNIKAAIVLLEWGALIKNFIEYVADDVYYIYYSDFNNQDDVINKLIKVSYRKFLYEFEKRKTGIDTKLFIPFGPQQATRLREIIIAHLRK